MKISLLKGKLPVIAAFCVSIGLVQACSDSNRSGNNSTMNTEVDTVGGVDNTAVDPVSPSGDTVTRTRKTGKVTVRPETPAKPSNPGTDANGYFNYTETAPMYTGGNGALQTYFDNNLAYPQDAVDNNAEGTVLVRFTIDEDGTVKNATTTGPKLGYGMEEEAVRVVNSMAAWTPGANNGKKVKAWYTLPVTFRLE